MVHSSLQMRNSKTGLGSELRKKGHLWAYIIPGVGWGYNTKFWLALRKLYCLFLSSFFASFPFAPHPSSLLLLFPCPILCSTVKGNALTLSSFITVREFSVLHYIGASPTFAQILFDIANKISICLLYNIYIYITYR